MRSFATAIVLIGSIHFGMADTAPLPPKDPAPLVTAPAPLVTAPAPLVTAQPAPTTEAASSDTAQNVGITKNVVQTVFFLVVGTVGMLTYLQARKTIFMPIRTETFKLQLKAFEDVLLFFEKHEESDITNAFDYHNILTINAVDLYDNFASRFFRDELNVEAMRKSREESENRPHGAMVSKEFMEEHFEIANEHIKKSKGGGEPEPDASKNPAIILARWQKYNHGVVHYSKKYHNAREAIRRFQISPVLPTGLKSLIKDFDSLASKNLMALGEVLTEAAKEMPDKYPTVDALKNSSFDWLWSRYNRKLERLHDAQTEILNYLNEYLDVDLICGDPTKRSKQDKRMQAAGVLPAPNP